MQIGASDMMIQGYHPITMRASPTMSISGTWNYEAGTTSGTWSTRFTKNKSNSLGSINRRFQIQMALLQ
jgi:hypothetical protein